MTDTSLTHLLGQFEQITLAALILVEKKGEAYGVTINEETKQFTKGIRKDITLGSCYITLSRLEQKGYVTSWIGGSTEIVGGRSKRLFIITDKGQNALRKSLTVARRLVAFDWK